MLATGSVLPAQGYRLHAIGSVLPASGYRLPAIASILPAHLSYVILNSDKSGLYLRGRLHS